MDIALVISVVALWVVVIVLALIVVALARQIGVLHERIAPAGALMAGGGPKVGDPGPVVTAPDLNGEDTVIGGANEAGRSTLVFFLSPSCPICKTLLPVLKSARRSEKDWLDIALASDGDPQKQRDFIASADLGEFSYLLSEPLGRSYAVGKLPYAVLLDEGGIIRSKGLVNSREHLESLFEAKERGVSSIQDFLRVQQEN